MSCWLNERIEMFELERDRVVWALDYVLGLCHVNNDFKRYSKGGVIVDIDFYYVINFFGLNFI